MIVKNEEQKSKKTKEEKKRSQKKKTPRPTVYCNNNVSRVSLFIYLMKIPQHIHTHITSLY